MRKLLVVVCFLLSVVNAHMWLRNPISQGGVNNIGGTSGPCANLKVGTGDLTTFEVGQSVTFQFRVNQHGPAPFAFALLDNNNTPLATIKANIPNQVTAGADGFDGVNVVVTIPNQLCDDCRVQLSGMGQNDGSGKWYNCARVKIVAQGQLTGPRPASVSPSSGPTSGGTEVTVTGTNFGASAGAIKCKFDSRDVTGTWVSATQVKCTSPPKNQAVDSTIEVAIGAGLFSSTGTIFTYTGADIPPIVERISPSQASPGETITIYGKNFYSPSLQCKFGNQTVEGTYISDTSMTCVVPEMTGSSALEVSVDGSPFSTSKKMFTEGVSNALTGGQIAGIIIGVVVVLSFILIPIILVVTKKWTLKSEPAPSNWGPLRGKV